MYVCSECGQAFNIPYDWTESYGQSFKGSPCCHANYDEASFCECGNIKEKYHEYCDKCEEVMQVDNG